MIQRRFERKTGAASRDDVRGPSGVRPQFELFAVHPKFAAGDFTDFFVDAAQFELTDLKAHGRTAVAAPSRLVNMIGP